MLLGLALGYILCNTVVTLKDTQLTTLFIGAINMSTYQTKVAQMIEAAVDTEQDAKDTIEHTYMDIKEILREWIEQGADPDHGYLQSGKDELFAKNATMGEKGKLIIEKGTKGDLEIMKLNTAVNTVSKELAEDGVIEEGTYYGWKKVKGRNTLTLKAEKPKKEKGPFEALGKQLDKAIEAGDMEQAAEIMNTINETAANLLTVETEQAA